MELTGLSRSEASRYLSAHEYPSFFYLIALRNVIFIMAAVSPGVVSLDSPNQGSRLGWLNLRMKNPWIQNTWIGRNDNI